MKNRMFFEFDSEFQLCMKITCSLLASAPIGSGTVWEVKRIKGIVPGRPFGGVGGGRCSGLRGSFSQAPPAVICGTHDFQHSLAVLPVFQSLHFASSLFEIFRDGLNIFELYIHDFQ